MSYIPPFEVSAKAINMIAEISALVERFAIRLEQADGLLLRKINRIKTIRGSLAIEGNTLSESMISDIIDGKNVVAPIREIQEAKNAIKVYDRYGSFDPFSIEDMLKAHGLMMEALVDDPGKFRKTGVGVFQGNVPIHVAPPAGKVPYLMEELFQWLKTSKDHLLIRSCVFHYEFEFIHPFSDGNGRIGRLWQSLILGKLNPVFEHLPVENMVFSNQQKYYEAIQKSTEKTDSGIFIDFMLEEILRTVEENPMTKTIVVNRNTVLKQIELSDTADIFNTVISQREYLGKWLPFVEFTHEMKDTEVFVRSAVDAPEEKREFVFVIHYDGEFAGLVGFKSTDRHNKKTEIGYWLSEGFQRKGIMTESVKCLIRFAFEELNINRIQIKCAVGNTPSSNIPKKLGFNFEGIEREGELFPDGTFKDLEIYSLLRNTL